MRHIAIVLARLDSSRLPHKALRKVHGTPLIGYALERARQIRSLAQVVLATTERGVDDPLAAYAQSAGVAVFRGATDNVAQRCVDCATLHGADYFVRLNADSPFPDPALIEEGLRALDADPPPDLAIEIEISRSVLDRIALYAAVGVRELWRFSSRLPPLFAPGLYRYRSVEESDRAREEALIERMRSVRRARRSEEE